MFAHNASSAEVRAFEVFRSLTAEVRSNVRARLFDVLQRPFEEVRVGDALYRARSQMLATLYPRTRGMDGELIVSACGLRIVGVGRTLEEAQRNWNEQFHVRFQTLLAKRPWEMDMAEK